MLRGQAREAENVRRSVALRGGLKTLDRVRLPWFLWCMRPPHLRLAMVAVFAANVGFAQKVISARAGLVYFVKGRVSVTGSGRLPTGARLHQLSSGEELFTERGRTEILMNPGAVLRLGEMSRLRMDDVDLTRSKVSIESGSAVVTVRQMPKPDCVLVEVNGAVVVLKHPGMYRFDADGSRLRVFDGRAELAEDHALVVKRGQSVALEDWVVARFNTKDSDDLESWAAAQSYQPPRGPRALPPRTFLAEYSIPPADPATQRSH